MLYPRNHILSPYAYHLCMTAWSTRTSQEEFQPYLLKTLALRWASCESAWPNLKHSCAHAYMYQTSCLFTLNTHKFIYQLCLKKVGGADKACRYAIFAEKKKSSFGLSEAPYYTLASELSACCTKPFKRRGEHLWDPRLPLPNWLVTPATLVRGSTPVPHSANWPVDDEPRETECWGYSSIPRIRMNASF